jgi:CO/xanthine dehydrogenase Mo-binding subunit
MSEKLKYVGGTYPNHDAGPKVTGALVYASDLKLPNMLHAKLLLSPIAHGLVKSIDASKAEAVPGVFGVFSRLRCPNGPRRSVQFKLQQDAGDQGPCGRFLWRQAGVHPGAGSGFSGDGYQVAGKMRARILELASEMLQKPVQNLRAAGGRVFDLDDRQSGLSYGEIASGAKLRYNTELMVAHTHYAASNPGAYAAQFAEVLVDAATGLIRVTDFLSVNDIGQAINTGMVEGQVQGAVQMGIGYALCEEVVVGKDGRVGNAGFTNYHLVNAPEMPDVRVILVEHAGDEGPSAPRASERYPSCPPLRLWSTPSTRPWAHHCPICRSLPGRYWPPSSGYHQIKVCEGWPEK